MSVEDVRRSNAVVTTHTKILAQRKLIEFLANGSGRGVDDVMRLSAGENAWQCQKVAIGSKLRPFPNSLAPDWSLVSGIQRVGVPKHGGSFSNQLSGAKD